MHGGVLKIAFGTRTAASRALRWLPGFLSSLYYGFPYSRIAHLIGRLLDETIGALRGHTHNGTKKYIG